jgi:hypothetical protein
MRDDSGIRSENTAAQQSTEQIFGQDTKCDYVKTSHRETPHGGSPNARGIA